MRVSGVRVGGGGDGVSDGGEVEPGGSLRPDGASVTVSRL